MPDLTQLMLKRLLRRGLPVNFIQNLMPRARHMLQERLPKGRMAANAVQRLVIGSALFIGALILGMALQLFQPSRGHMTEANIGAVPVEAIRDVASNAAISRPASRGLQEGDTSCAVNLGGRATAGAMVYLQLSAPCNRAERVTIHHMGMMFTQTTTRTGHLSLRVPALDESAVFIASFASGAGATARIDVPSMPFYDRTVVQWRGAAGLHLHAREFTNAYFGEGHVWADARGDLALAARGEGGFLTRLGNPSIPGALMAEGYSFPSRTATRSGNVLLSVEAEVTPLNCSDPVEAQTIEVRKGSAARVRDLMLEMPSCETIGDFLVLKNLVEDLTIAAR